MSTSLSTKFAALALALVVNSAIMGGVAFMFSDRLEQASNMSIASHGAPVVAAVA